MAVADSVARASPSQPSRLLQETTHEAANGDTQPADGGPKAPVRVVVVGGGLAGLSATIEVLKRGGSVTIVEKCQRLGGNSAKASSGINAAGSTPQIAAGIEDSLELFKTDTIKSGKGRCNAPLVDVLVEHSADAISFLQSYGVDLSNLSQCGGHSKPRTHRSRPDGNPINVGYRIMSTMITFIESQPSDLVQIVTRATAKSLILNRQGRTVGVTCDFQTDSKSGDHITETIDVFGDAVILATGGFSADRDGLLKAYVPAVKDVATTNGPWATGDGLKMAKAIGASVVDMDQVQLHPTGFVDLRDATNPTKFLAPEALRGVGGVLLNQKGQRFVNELTTRDACTKAIMANCDPLPTELGRDKVREGGVLPTVAYLLLNDAAVDVFDRDVANFYSSKGLIHKFDNISALCTAWHLPEEQAVRELEFYGRQEKDPFGKTVFPTLFEVSGPVYGAVITPSLHYTMGGLRVTTGAEVVRPNGAPIPGLFAAGEVTGGVHGGNRLAGNSLLECVVFGRIAGVNAWKSKTFSLGLIRRHRSYVDSKGVVHEAGLLPTKFTPLALTERYTPNCTCAVLRFALPSPDHSLGLLCGQYLACRASPGKGKEAVVQYYSPMTPADEYGHFDLVIKQAGAPEGSMPHILMNLKIGDFVEFAGPLGGFEYSPNQYQTLGMIAGGTGISPMLQIMRTVMRHPSDSTHLSLLLGNIEEDDILSKEEVMYYMTRENVDVSIWLEKPPVRWRQGRGRINKEALEKHMPRPGTNAKIIMCGPPPMMRVMKQYLRELGYPDKMVYCFNDPDCN